MWSARGPTEIRTRLPRICRNHVCFSGVRTTVELRFLRARTNTAERIPKEASCCNCIKIQMSECLFGDMKVWIRRERIGVSVIWAVLRQGWGMSVLRG